MSGFSSLPTEKKVHVIQTVVGGFLIHFVLGNLYSWGNLSPYIASYMRIIHGQNVEPGEMAYGLGIMFSVTPCAMIMTYYILKKIRVRYVLLLGATIYWIGSFVSAYFLYNVPLFLFFQCFVVALGKGMCYTPPITCGIKLLPIYKGVIVGFISAGFGISSIAFNVLQMWYINPHNIKRQEIDNQLYFTDNDLLERLPGFLIIISFVQCSIVMIGALLIYDEPVRSCDSTNGIELVSCNNTRAASTTSYVIIKENNIGSISTVIDTPKDIPIIPTQLGVLEIIKSRKYKELVSIFVFDAFIITFVSMMSKTAYGSERYNDDQFLTFAGCIGALGSTLGRIIWGKIGDDVGAGCAMLFMTGTWSLSFIWYVLTAYYGKTYFVLSVFMLYFCLGGHFALFPILSQIRFGVNNLQLSYGLITLWQIVISTLSSYLFSLVNKISPWLCVNMYMLASFLVFTLVFCLRSRLQKP